MDILNRIQFEVKKEDRVYSFQIPMNAPLGESYQVVLELVDKFVALINENAEKLKPAVESSESVIQEIK